MNSPVFPIIVSCAAIFATVYFNNRKIKIEMKRENDNKIKCKADLDYVDQQDRSLHKRIDSKADKSLVESMDKKLDLILNKLD